MYLCPNPRDHAPVAAIHVRKLNGASQPSLIATEDGTLYVIKCLDFVGQFGLMSEVIGSELMAGMGLPVPKWEPILLTEEFLCRNPNLWFRGRPDAKGICPEDGLAFGTRFTVSKGRNHTHDVIPSSWTERVLNQDDFVGALLFDLWANNCDRRQCVFLTDDHARTLRAVFIDNDNLFGGYFANEKTCPRRVMLAKTDIYRNAWTEEAVSRWRGKIDQLDDTFIDHILSRIPVEWMAYPALKFATTELSLRRRKLNYLIGEVEDVFASGRFPSVEVLRSDG